MTVFVATYYTLWVANLGLSLACIHAEWRRRSPFLIFWGALLLVFVLASIADPFITAARVNVAAPLVALANNPAIITAHLIYFAFAAGYLLTRRLLPGAGAVYGPEFYRSLVGVQSPGIDRLVLILAGFAALLMLYAVGFSPSSLFNETYSGYRLGADTAPRMVAFYVMLAVSGGTFVYAMRRRWGMVAAIGVTALLMLSASHTRQVMLPVILPFALYFVTKRTTAPVKTLAVMAAFGIVLYAVFGFLQVLRYAGSTEAALRSIMDGTVLQIASRYFVQPEAGFMGGEAAIRIPLYYFVEHGHAIPGFGSAYTLIRMALFWCPSFVGLIDKPINFDQVLYNSYYVFDQNSIDGTLHISLFGALFMDVGWWAILTGIPLAFLAAWLDRATHRMSAVRAALLIGPLCYFVAMLARGSIVNTGTIFIASYLALWAIELGSQALEVVVGQTSGRSQGVA